MAERFRLLVVASKEGFYGDRLHYPADSGHKRAGAPFALLADALRYDAEGKMHVNKDLYPILPTWVIPKEPLKKIDPKLTPHVIVAEKPKKPGRRIIQGVKDVAPQAWPASARRRVGLDDDREVKVKRAGNAAIAEMMEKEEDDGE